MTRFTNRATPISALKRLGCGAAFLRRGSATRKSLSLRARASRNFLHHHFVAELTRFFAARATRQESRSSPSRSCWLAPVAIERQANADAGALVELAFNRDRPAVQADEPAHDRQPKTRAFIATVIGGAGLEKRIAEIGQIVWRDADAGIGDAHDDIIAVGTQLDGDAPATRREFDRVREQVEQNLLIGPLVADDLVDLLRERRGRVRRRLRSL